MPPDTRWRGDSENENYTVETATVIVAMKGQEARLVSSCGI